MSEKYEALRQERETTTKEIQKTNDLLYSLLGKRKRIEDDLEACHSAAMAEKTQIIAAKAAEIEAQEEKLKALSELRNKLVPHVSEMKKLLVVCADLTK